MPLAYLRTLDGRDVPIDAVDITRTIEDFGLPPADIAAIVNAQNGRRDVASHQITASQAGQDAREIYLRDITPFAREPRREMAALRGTMRHAVINCEHPGLSVEQRVVSTCGRFSAKYDSYVPETGVLRDAKFPKFYTVLMILKHGLLSEAKAYVQQLNLAALILRQNGQRVTEMWLDFEPQGVGKQEKVELETKYQITEPTRILMEVPWLEPDAVWAHYTALYEAKARAMETGEAPPICSSAATWGGKKCAQGWCPVADACARLAAERGERHPWIKPAKEQAA
jgi:hypothetical protein